MFSGDEIARQPSALFLTCSIQRLRRVQSPCMSSAKITAIVARAILPGLCTNAHQLIPAAAAVKAAATNEQHDQNDDDEGGGVHDRSSALRSAFECKGRA
jgi:hypothetical protein